MARSKTGLRHVDSKGNVHRVTREGEDLYIGNSNDRAEGKCVHHSQINHNGTGHIERPNFSPEGDEWDDYAWSADDY